MLFDANNTAVFIAAATLDRRPSFGMGSTLLDAYSEFQSNELHVSTDLLPHVTVGDGKVRWWRGRDCSGFACSLPAVACAAPRKGHAVIDAALPHKGAEQTAESSH